MNINIASWNINSIRARETSLQKWIFDFNPDIIGLQETKVIDDQFPEEFFYKNGFDVRFFGQKSYNGVCLAFKRGSSIKCENVVKNIPSWEDEQARVITCSLLINDLHRVNFISVYVPNGSSVGDPKFSYKLLFLQKLTDFVKQLLKENDSLCMMGDFNIAPTDLDVFDPELWREKVLCSSIERKKFSEFQNLFLADSFRLKNKKPNQYSWWDYRQGSFRKNAGLRIDHILLSNPLISICADVGISSDVRKHEKPSDHAPVWVNLEFKN